VIESGGEATIWVGQPQPAAQERALARSMAEAVAIEYAALSESAAAAMQEPRNVRPRTAARLRRELRRIQARDYFPPAERHDARTAVDNLVNTVAESLQAVDA
jgi:hypothetical protein